MPTLLLRPEQALTGRAEVLQPLQRRALAGLVLSVDLSGQDVEVFDLPDAGRDRLQSSLHGSLSTPAQWTGWSSSIRSSVARMRRPFGDVDRWKPLKERPSVSLLRPTASMKCCPPR